MSFAVRTLEPCDFMPPPLKERKTGQLVSWRQLMGKIKLGNPNQAAVDDVATRS